jgi:hypothetical protein
MNSLEGLLPIEIDHFDDTLHYTSAYKILFERITRLGQMTTEYINRTFEEDDAHAAQLKEDEYASKRTFMSEPREREKIQKLFDTWLEYFIIHMEPMREIQIFVIDGKKVRTTLGIHVFTELTRLNLLLQRPRLMVDLYEEEMQSLENTHHPSWIQIVESFDITSQYEEKEEKDAEVEHRLLVMKDLWKKPILSYTQVQVQMVILFLTQQLNEVRSDSILEFKAVFEWLWIRVAQLQVEPHDISVLDDPEMRITLKESLFAANREFAAFVTFYMGEINRRFFYFNMLSKRKIVNTFPRLEEQKLVCQKWIEHVIGFFAEEAFTDVYTDSCNESYSFAGDDVWFKYRWPLKVHSRAACLAELRPHLYRRFFSESRASRISVLNSIQTSHVARFFVFKAISQYIQIKMGGASDVKWYNGVVKHNDDIHMSTYNLRAGLAPFLLQVFSTYWAYQGGYVWRSDDFYETLVVWFNILREKYNSTLFDHDLTAFVDAAIGPKERQRESNEREERIPLGFLL